MLNDPHRWFAETKVIVKSFEILLSNVISNIHNHSVESVFEKIVKGEKKKNKIIPLEAVNDNIRLFELIKLFYRFSYQQEINISIAK